MYFYFTGFKDTTTRVNTFTTFVVRHYHFFVQFLTRNYYNFIALYTAMRLHGPHVVISQMGDWDLLPIMR